jgi:hypothetical protein
MRITILFIFFAAKMYPELKIWVACFAFMSFAAVHSSPAEVKLRSSSGSPPYQRRRIAMYDTASTSMHIAGKMEPLIALLNQSLQLKSKHKHVNGTTETSELVRIDKLGNRTHEESEAFSNDMRKLGAQSFYLKWLLSNDSLPSPVLYRPSFSKSTCEEGKKGTKSLAIIVQDRCETKLSRAMDEKINACDCKLCSDYSGELGTPFDKLRYAESAHVLDDAIVDENGLAKVSETVISVRQCMGSSQMMSDVSQPILSANIVLVATQVWSSAYFHKVVECFSRLAPYLPLLRAREDIMVHVPNTDYTTTWFAERLGIQRDRLISGTVSAAKLILPGGCGCGGTPTLRAQLLHRELGADETSQEELVDGRFRRHVLILKRSKSRQLPSHSDLKKRLTMLAHKYGRQVLEFSDDTDMNHDRTRFLFNRADVIIAGHGAGLTNILHSRRGTVVIEALCETIHMNLCYASLASQLGMRYHGIVANKPGCPSQINVDLSEILDAAASALEYMSRKSTT